MAVEWLKGVEIGSSGVELKQNGGRLAGEILMFWRESGLDMLK